MLINDILIESKIFTEEFLEEFSSRCAISIDRYHRGCRLYRGIQSTAPYVFVDPTKQERKAANTENFFNLYFSNAPEWAAYPKRNRSTICTSSAHVASGYSKDNNYYVVFPFDNPLIGICPKQDMWICFKPNVGTVSFTLYTAFRNIISEYPEYKYRKIPDSDANELMDFLNTMDLEKSSKLLSLLNDYSPGNIPQNITIKQWLQTSYSPKDFSLQKLSNLNVGNNNEMWFSSSAYLINSKYVKAILQQI